MSHRDHRLVFFSNYLAARMIQGLVGKMTLVGALWLLYSFKFSGGYICKACRQLVLERSFLSEDYRNRRVRGQFRMRLITIGQLLTGPTGKIFNLRYLRSPTVNCLQSPPQRLRQFQFNLLAVDTWRGRLTFRSFNWCIQRRGEFRLGILLGKWNSFC